MRTLTKRSTVKTAVMVVCCIGRGFKPWGKQGTVKLALVALD